MNDEVRVVPAEGFLRDVFRLPEDLHKRVDERIHMLKKKGWAASVRTGDVVSLEGGIWELRVVARGPAFRILFFTDTRHCGRLLVLTACLSKAALKKAHVMKTEIDRAKMRRAQWLQQEATR